MTAGDRGVVALVVALTFLWLPSSIASAFAPAAEGVIITSPEGTTTLSLDDEGTYRVEGRSGIVTVRVAGEKAWVVEAPCPDGLCQRSGAARAGRPVICSPNGVSVEVQPGGGGDVLDAVSR